MPPFSSLPDIGTPMVALLVQKIEHIDFDD
jgi:hypothetical protein